ncbi:PLP-dependent lyase/thiolase [Ilumatobacter sp.]|uniref:PLP-dependent lyase/thiolase n=1 Tax=Ilumatobacter sp. TaxID=1967498 RepID=UPI003C36E8D8
MLVPITVHGSAHSEQPSSDHPFIAHDARLAWAATADALGMTPAARAALVRELDDAVREVDGTGFVVTPFTRSDVLSDELGFSDAGGVWVKDETGGVGGSQKSRHLFSILLHLRAMELLGELVERPRLAIASCGNAALAAATLACAARWPIDVYVPTWMSDGFGDRLDELGATVHRCARRSEDLPGDPAMLRFREAVENGSVPFTVQGPENALCLDGGRTIGWEIGAQVHAPEGPGRLDGVFVQVGGGAFAASLGSGLNDDDPAVPLFAVQAEGCAPFDRARRRSVGLDDPASQWEQVMTPWTDPASLADGILDDETYDWLGVLDAIDRSGGRSVVASEANIVAAHELAHRAGFDASATGSSGLAGLLQVVAAEPRAESAAFDPTACVAVVMSGITR